MKITAAVVALAFLMAVGLASFGVLLLITLNTAGH
jgi:hypothetical protein